MSSTLATTLTIAAIAAGVAGTGTAIYEGDKSRDASAAATASNAALVKQEQQTTANQANLAKQEAVLGAQGQSQQQTGGSLTDSGTSALTDLLAGYPGYQAGASGSGTSTGAGIGSSGVSGSAPAAGSTGTPDIAALLKTLSSGAGGGLGSNSPSSISGGNWQTQPSAPQSRFELANPVV